MVGSTTMTRGEEVHERDGEEVRGEAAVEAPGCGQHADQWVQIVI